MEIKGIPHSSLIDIQVSGLYLARMQSLYLHLYNQMSEQDQAEFLLKLKEQQDLTSHKVYPHLETILMFLLTVENEAKEQDKLSTKVLTDEDIEKLKQEQNP